MATHGKIKQKISSIFDKEYQLSDIKEVESHILHCQSCRKFRRDIEQLSVKLKKWMEDTIPKELERSINSLPKEQKEAITLLEYHKLSYAKISQIIRKPPDKVAQMIYKTRCKLLNVNPLLILARTHVHKILLLLFVIVFIHIIYQLFQNQRTVKYIIDIRDKRDDITSMMNVALDVSSNEMIKISSANTAGTSTENSGNSAQTDTSQTEEDEDSLTTSALNTRRYPWDIKVKAINFTNPGKNHFLKTQNNSSSFCPLNVRTFSYKLIQQFLESGRMPPKYSARVEELVNAFNYININKKNANVALKAELSPCPWNSDNHLLWIRINTKMTPETKVLLNDAKMILTLNPDMVDAYTLLGYRNYNTPRQAVLSNAQEGEDLLSNYAVNIFYELKLHERPGLNNPEAPERKMPLVTLGLTCKEAGSRNMEELRQDVYINDIKQTPSLDSQFAASVLEFGLLLSDSPLKGKASFEHVLKAAQGARGKDLFGYRKQFIEFVKKAEQLYRR